MASDNPFLWLVLLVFNLPVVAVIVFVPFVAKLKDALSEKDPVGGPTDTTSYSRVTGLLGAVVVTSFFWATGNIILLKALNQTADIKPITDNVGRFFLVGSALFLPYAFNQIKSVFNSGSMADGDDNPPAQAPAGGGALNVGG